MSARPLLGNAALALCLVLASVCAGAAQTPTAPAAPSSEDCLACHGDSTATRANGSSIAVAQDVFGKSVHGALACVSCHADLAKTTEWPHPEKLERVSCQTCHGQQGTNYDDSVHGLAVTRSGLGIAPRCATCHGSHDIQRKDNPESKVHRTRIAATCTTCHDGILPLYAGSVHAQGIASAKGAGATCSDCHTAHRIQRSETDAWRLSVIGECGTCHLDRIATYRDTFHGQITALESVRSAMCSDCHGNHAILPASNPASMVSPQNLVSTCQRCHAQANEQFAKYDPHADKHDPSRSAAVYWTYRFMQLLLASIFLFFGVHTLLWFPRSYKARREQDAAHTAGGDSAS